MPMKKKMDPLTKIKLIYSGELMLFAVVFLVLAILKFTQVMKTNANRLTVFNWITLFGGAWMIADFFWALFDKKRQKRIAMIDKFLTLPAGLYLIVFDLYCLIKHPPLTGRACTYGVPVIFTYFFLIYTFQAIYHFKHPVPGLLNAVVEVDDDKVVDEQEAVVIEEENKEIASSEEKEKQDE